MVRLARRRRLGRRLGVVAVPVVLVGWFVVTSADDGPPDAVSVLALLALAAAVAVGWWWLERGAGRSWAGLRARSGPSGPTAEQLADARAELALRTCSPPAPGDRVRVEGLVDR
ncbi:hypothetical protein SAMN05660199_02393 [Klenkia soli]|uniref:Uncharacterized protein n=2 Tax=Klenkia soli TaxID=1052260 RepID=A0A1H0LRG0_9ACTN|nr:hypothetical protein SAMN05660199_02393 [Klenkia soli]